jgi:mannosyl-3-phosphoglycerate phosphatase
MLSEHKIIVYSDLDGTFLDHKSYSYAESLPALKLLTEKGIPVVFCSSKTQMELETIWEELPGKGPFITENGAAIYVPVDFFDFQIHESRIKNLFKVIEMGFSYDQVLECFRTLQVDFPEKLIGFSNMTEEELATDSGLSVHNARLAKQREYSEVFKFIDFDPKNKNFILKKIEEYGFQWSKGGRYYHLHGQYDKGKALTVLNLLFEKAYGRIRTFGVGDSLNDLALLGSVDVPVLVKKHTGHYEKKIIKQLPHVRLADGIGPKGWTLAVEEIIAEL